MKSKILLIALFLTQLPLPATAQNPYRLKGGKEAIWLGGSGAAIGLSFVLQRNTKALTPEVVTSLDAGRVPAFDRFAIRHYSTTARSGSDWMLYSSAALPLLLLADREIRRDAPQSGLLVGEVMLVNTGLTLLAKELVRRPRPFVYNAQAPLAEKLKTDARRSFFSGHNSTVAAFAFSTAKIWSDYHPDSKWRPVVWAGAGIIPLSVGYLRMRGGKHFLSDVLTGFAVGAASGWLIPQLHRRR